MTAKKKTEKRAYVSVKMKPEEYQVLVTTKEMIKLMGLDHLKRRGIEITDVSKFDFTLGEISSIACCMCMRSLGNVVDKIETEIGIKAGRKVAKKGGA